MKRALTVGWFAIRGVYEDILPLSGMGFLWFLAAVLLPYGGLYLAATLQSLWAAVPIVLASLVLAPPVTAALYHVCRYLARERAIRFSYFWEGLKTYFWPSLKVAGLMLLAGALLVVDALFFFRIGNALFAILGFLLLWVFVFWVAIQVYLFPLLIAMEEKRLWPVFKTSGQLALAFPVFTLLMLLLAVLGTVVSFLTLIPLLTVWMPFVTLLFSRSLISSWQEVGRLQEGYREADERRG
jgi:uncharacterized membrane protein YesL